MHLVTLASWTRLLAQVAIRDVPPCCESRHDDDDSNVKQEDDHSNDAVDDDRVGRYIVTPHCASLLEAQTAVDNTQQDEGTTKPSVTMTHRAAGTLLAELKMLPQPQCWLEEHHPRYNDVTNDLMVLVDLVEFVG